MSSVFISSAQYCCFKFAKVLSISEIKAVVRCYKILEIAKYETLKREILELCGKTVPRAHRRVVLSVVYCNFIIGLSVKIEKACAINSIILEL